MAAADIDALHGREISREALIHHGIALRGVNKALVDQHKVPEMIDECIVAVTLLAAQGVSQRSTDKHLGANPEF